MKTVPRLQRSAIWLFVSQPFQAGLTFGFRPYGPGSDLRSGLFFAFLFGRGRVRWEFALQLPRSPVFQTDPAGISKLDQDREYVGENEMTMGHKFLLF
jgi:hypothetical protein